MGRPVYLEVDCILYPTSRSITGPLDADAPAFIPRQPTKSVSQVTPLVLKAYYCNALNVTCLFSFRSLLNCAKSNALLFSETWYNDNITVG